MTEFVICFVNIIEISKCDIRIPGECILAVYKIIAENECQARVEAGKLFETEYPDEDASEYIVSCGFHSS